MNALKQLGNPTLLIAGAALLAVTVLGSSASAQDDVFAPAENKAPAETADPATQTDASQGVSIGQLLAGTEKYPPPTRLGARAHVLREAQQVIDAVVIVENATDAARAISAWGGLTRFPVLIDDGSLLAAENIARFTRAFEPGNVLRWSPDDTDPWPEELVDSASRMIGILGNTLERGSDMGMMTQVLEKMRESGVGPNGAVMIDPGDESWIAGLALAAGRMQAMTFVEFPGRTNGEMTGNEMRSVASAIQQQLEAVGTEWEKMGDEVDSITLVGNGALRVSLGIDGKDEKALTDLIGRHRGGIGNRWAWSGVVFGDAQGSLYRVMCGLFLVSDSAWLFDGYGRGDPWDLYDATSAGNVLERGGYSVEVHDLPENRVRDWRAAVQRGIDADLALINSRGGVTYFALGDGDAYSGDIPLLESPIAVHLVHSWSSRVPGSVRSIAGRWIEHGAYLFYGSIDEPFLPAFVPTPQVAGRLLGGLPWGVGVRQPTGPAWKLNVIGDPLVTFIPGSKGGSRISGQVSFAGSRPMKEIITEQLKGGDFAQTIRSLTLAGRDKDAARLSSALLADRPEVVGNDAAFWMVMPLYRAGRFDEMADAYNRIDPKRQKTMLLQDALWHAGRNTLAAGPNTKLEGLMRRNLRQYQEEHDAVEIAAAISARVGPREAASFLEGVAVTIDNEKRRKVVTDAVRRFGGPTRP